MYALMTLLAAGIEAGADAVAKRVGTARRRRVINHAGPLTDATPGSPREITGRAVAGPAGPVSAPLSGESCVWYTVLVLERYHAWRPGPLGPVKVVRHVKLAERNSGPLYVTGDHATVRVEVGGADLDLGRPVFAEYEDAGPGGPLATRLSGLGIRVHPRHRDRTLGIVVQERVVTADEPLYVVGQVRTELGDLVVSKPPMRPFIVSKATAAPAAGRQD
jgi:E3 Ubiquitin ligase